jgi:hypothetical protein
MTQNNDSDPETLTLEEQQEFRDFQEQVYYALKTLLMCCFVRDTSRSDEINTAVDVLILCWMYSSFCQNYSTDIDYGSHAASNYQMMQRGYDVATKQMLLELREECETSDTETLRKCANVADFTYGELQKNKFGHNWRSDISGAAVDTMSNCISLGAHPADVESAMLLLCLVETSFNPVEFGEFVISRYRSRISSYQEAVDELHERVMAHEN